MIETPIAVDAAISLQIYQSNVQYPKYMQLPWLTK